MNITIKLHKNMEKMRASLILFVVFFFQTGEAIRCYQCSSGHDPKGEDICGANGKFDKSRHFPIDCNSDESHTPGSFCMKIVQQSQRGFIWDGRWRQVIRRCASVAETGVTGVCNWGVYPNNVFWEECYCSEDGCNKSSGIHARFLYISCAFIILKLLNVYYF